MLGALEQGFNKEIDPKSFCLGTFVVIPQVHAITNILESVYV